MVETGFAYRRTGTCGCEIIDPDGEVFAWTVDSARAGLIVGLLNWVEENGLSRPAQCHQHSGGIGPVEENTADQW
jgi:hypothetical protein